MTKTTILGDGKTKQFRFDFPFFTRDDVTVAINGRRAATGYAVQIGKPNDTGTFPYSFGTISFARAPKLGSVIEIQREFVMTRPCDYQTKELIQPHDLNNDFNFNLENMKDFRERLDGFAKTYASITNLSDIDGLAARMDAVIAAIESMDVIDIDGNETVLQIKNEILAIKSDIGSMLSRIAALDDGDYVIETKTGLTGAKYTNGWYRKYKSGWIEQGYITSETANINANSGTRLPSDISIPIPIVHSHGVCTVNQERCLANLSIIGNTTHRIWYQNVSNANASNVSFRVYAAGMAA